MKPTFVIAGTKNATACVGTGGLSLVGLILAAGESKRFGGNKLLASLQGKSILEWAIAPFLWRKIPLHIVIGAYEADMRKIFQRFPVKVIMNEHYRSEGMSSSVIIGAKAISASKFSKVDGLFIHPADVPMIKVKDLEILEKAFFMQNGNIIIPTFHGTRGHPLLISAKYLRELENLEESRNGLKGFLEDHSSEIALVESGNAGILQDIDTRGDLKDLRMSFHPDSD